MGTYMQADARRRTPVEVRNQGCGTCFARGGGGVVYVGSWDSYFYALDAETGLEKWSLKTGEDPAIHNQVGFQSLQQWSMA
jgi:outer membrane protein assembly factor BamB